MKRYFRFRKDFRCNWNGILGLYDTANLEDQPVEYINGEKHMWHRCKNSLLKTGKYYCDIFVFESDGETQEYVDELNGPHGGYAYFVKKEDESDDVEELLDYVLAKSMETGEIEHMFEAFELPFIAIGNDLSAYRVLGAIETERGLIYATEKDERTGDWKLL